MIYLMIVVLANGTLQLGLQDAKKLAVANSYHYQEARAKLGSARTGFARSLSNLLPTPQAGASYTKSESDRLDTKTYTGDLTISQPVFDLPLATQVKASHYQYLGERLAYQRDVQSLLLAVETAYLNLVRTRELLNSARLTVDRTKENERLTTEKFNLGAASKLDRLQAEVFSLQAERDLSQARRSYFEAHEGLRTYLNTRDDLLPTDTLYPVLSAPLPPLDSLIAAIDQVNIGLKAAREAKKVARLGLVSSYFRFLPRISIFFRYGYTCDQMPENLDEFRDHDGTSYGVNVDLPILNIKDLYFANRDARSNYRYEKYVFLRTLAETRQALVTSYQAIAESEDRVKLSAKSLELAEEAANIAKERYRLGAASIIDLLTAEENLYKARVNNISALADQRIEHAKLQYFLGSLEVE